MTSSHACSLFHFSRLLPQTMIPFPWFASLSLICFCGCIGVVCFFLGAPVALLLNASFPETTKKVERFHRKCALGELLSFSNRNSPSPNHDCNELFQEVYFALSTLVDRLPLLSEPVLRRECTSSSLTKRTKPAWRVEDSRSQTFHAIFRTQNGLVR
jgi:hypothetical protein